MLHKLLGGLSLLTVVELGVAVDPIVSVLQQRVTQHVVGRVMPVLPDQRNGSAIVVNKRPRTNCSTVGASQVISCGVATEVEVSLRNSHFDYSSCSS